MITSVKPGSAILIAKYDDFRFSWQSRFISAGEVDSKGAFVPNTVACVGLLDAAGAPLKCRSVSYTEDYMSHNFSVGYIMDNYEISTGVRNVFNKRPPSVDGGVMSFVNNNIPLGVGYDEPRTMFVNFSVKM